MVVCLTPLYVFEQWNLLVMLLELYRLQRVDRVIIYIQSLDVTIFRLLQLYEADGLVAIRKAFVLPKVELMSKNPNTANMWNNENFHYNDCLYEHREITDFVAVHSPDEVLMSPSLSNPLAAIIGDLFHNTPKAAYLFVNTILGYKGFILYNLLIKYINVYFGPFN
jgi:hypothetical protein